METTATARRPRRLPRIAAALGAVVLSLVLVFHPKTTPPAEALAGAVPIAIGGAISSAPAGSAVVGGLCATGAGCLALAAIGLGITAYATRDTWMPWVKGFFNEAPTEWPQRADGSTGPPGAVQISNFGPVNGNPLQWMASGRQVDGLDIHYMLRPSIQLSVSQVQCRSKSNGEIFAATNGNAFPGGQLDGQTSGSSGVQGLVSTTLPENICGTLADVVSVVGQVIGRSGSTFSSPKVGFTFPLPDAEWEQTVDVTCRSGSGDTFKLTDTETGNPDRLAIPSCRSTDPSSIPTDIRVRDQFGNDMLTWTPPDYGLDYPNCFGPSGLLCDIRVWVGNVPCNVGVAGCEHWWNNRNSPERDYSCRFGEYVVPFSQCEPLRRSYTSTTPQIVVEPSWPPAPEAPTDPEVTPPAEPEPSPTGPGNPEPSSPTDPLDPEVENPMPPIPQDPENPDTTGQSCMGDAWSFNPVKWVYVPVKCALIWGFKPKVSLQLRLERIQGSITTKVPFSWISGFVGVPGAIPSTGCPDWTVHVGSYSKNVVCGSSFTDAIRASRPVLLVFMGSLALWPLIRSTAYAAFPIIKPQPGVLR